MMAKMYRTESYQGSGKRSPVDVLTYEFAELGNMDAIDYITKHYLVNNPYFEEELERLGRLYEEFELDENDVESFFKEALDEIRKLTGRTINYVLWLAPLDTVVNYYLDGNPEPYDIGEYETDDGIILSELDGGEKLFGFSELPKAKYVDLNKKHCIS